MRPTLLLVPAVLLAWAGSASPCQRLTPVSPAEMVRNAEAIVRAVAADYAVPPRDPSIRTTGQPDSRVRLRVVEVIRGEDFPPELILPGYLSDHDDFNDRPVPYDFVRPNGRAGSCFANTYRRGASFLLLLKRSDGGGYTPNWYALGPVNEQLGSDDDPWLLWVRQQAGTVASAEPAPCRQPVLDRLVFLTGRWEVRTRTRLSANPADWEESVATSVIESNVRDCVVLERATGTRRGKRFEAMRVFAAKPGGRGLQVAVTDSEHGPLFVYEGTAGDSGLAFTMPLVNPAGTAVLLRIVYDRIRPGGFATRSERSTDQGRTWDTTGQAEYRRRDGP